MGRDASVLRCALAPPVRCRLVRSRRPEHAPPEMTRNQFRALAAIAALVSVARVAMPALRVDPTRSPSTGTVPTAAPPSSDPSAAPNAAASAEPSDVDEEGQGNGQGNGNGNGPPDKTGKPDKDHA